MLTYFVVDGRFFENYNTQPFQPHLGSSETPFWVPVLFTGGFAAYNTQLVQTA
jgi:hypothetical protein